MRKTALGLLGVVLLLAGGAWAQATAKTAASVEMSLKDLETKWAAAALKSDSVAVGDIVSEDWTGINTEGQVRTRGEMLAEVKNSKLTKSAVSDMRVRVLDGDAAVVTGTWAGAGTDPGGKKFDATERWTDVFVYKNGKWKCVSSQSTTVKK